MRGLGMCAAALVIVSVCASAAQADLLDVQLTPPILVTFDLKVTYDADGAGSDGLLTAYGTFDPWGSWKALQDYSLDGVTSTDNYLGYFLLTAVIDKAERKSVSGSLCVSSDQDTGWLGGGDGMYGWLEGDTDFSGGDLDTWEVGERAHSTDLLAFGYGGYGLFDFVFGNATGDMTNSGGVSVILAGLFDGEGQYSLPVGWDTLLYDFENAGGGKADIPEPATMSLLILGGLAMIRRRRTSRSA